MSAGSFGPFVFDHATGTLSRDGRAVAIGTRSAALLSALLEANGAPVTKDALIEAGWPGLTVEEGNLSVQIANLRKAMGLRDDGIDWITTVPRIGYRLVTSPVPESLPTPASVLPSLAVLPFQNLSGDVGQDYFADGMVEDIITALSRFRSFAVIARNSSFVYKGRAVDVRQIARELSVRYLLEGSVRKIGNRLRINAQLIDAENGAHLWAHNFDGSSDDIFDFQDRITSSVAAIVAPRIEEAERRRMDRERPASAAVHDLYLRALHKFDTLHPDENAAGTKLLERALTLEPSNPAALALMAHLLEHRVTTGWAPYGTNDRDRAIELARAALRSAGDDAAVLTRCGIVLLMVGREFDNGLAILQRAATINPNNAMVIEHLAIGHLLAGTLEDAIAGFHRVVELNLSEAADSAMTGIGHAELCRGNYEEALVWATRALGTNPNFNPTYWVLIAANVKLGRMDEARRLLLEFRKVAPNVTVASLAAGHAERDPQRMAAILEGLRLAGLPEG